MKKRKKTIRIDFRCCWWHFNPENNIFINLLKKDFNVILNKKNPEYVFFSVFDGKRPIQSKKYGKTGKKIGNFSPLLYKILREIYYFRKERWKMPIIKGDFVKIFFVMENSRPNMEKCDWAFTNDYDERIKNPRHFRIPGHAFSSMKDPGILIKNKDYNPKEIMKNKKKFCVFVCSNDVTFRNKFFKKLNRYKKVESWGKCLNNMGKRMPKLVEINKDIKSKGEIKEYVENSFLAQYKFTIAFENSSHVGYTSERTIEPMRANNIPIYWGNPLIHKDFNSKSFINYHYFERKVKKRLPYFFFKVPILKFLTKKYVEMATFKKMIARIIELDKNDDLYMDLLKEPWYNDNKVPKELDKERIRKRLKEIIQIGKKVRERWARV